MLEIWYGDEAKIIRMRCLKPTFNPKKYALGRVVWCPKDRCLNKSSHPAPVWTSGHCCYMHDLGTTTASFTRGTHSDRSMSLLFLALRAVMASLKASAEHAPGSWKQQRGEGCASLKGLMVSIGPSTWLIFWTEIANKHALRPSLLPLTPQTIFV